MRCTPIHGRNDTCRRCHRAGLPCVFVPRANAATLPDLLGLGERGQVSDEHFKRDVLDRLRNIEDCLGLTSSSKPTTADSDRSHLDVGRVPAGSDSEDDDSFGDPTFGPLWEALHVLRRICPSGLVPPSTWRRATIVELWSSYVDVYSSL